MQKQSYQVTSKHRCTSCSKPLKANLVKRKTTLPKFCYWCYVLLVKKLVSYASKRVEHLVNRNKRQYKR